MTVYCSHWSTVEDARLIEEFVQNRNITCKFKFTGDPSIKDDVAKMFRETKHLTLSRFTDQDWKIIDKIAITGERPFQVSFVFRVL